MPLQCIAQRTAAFGIAVAYQVKDDATGHIFMLSVQELVEYIEKFKVGSVYCGDGINAPRVKVEVRQSETHKFPQTKADDTWTNNLDSLPLF